jgi:hypothetical protein
MEEFNFYRPEGVKPLYAEIVPAYQAAFAGEPWYEVSKCVDRELPQRCVGGLSSLAVGATCEVCDNKPTKPAYEKDELVARFEELASSRPTAWYTERSDAGLALAAVAWRAAPMVIAKEKYPDVPEMAEWLEATLGANDIVWLDEVFANKNLRGRGNLANFKSMVDGFAERLESPTIAYRTINPAMVRAATRDFGDDVMAFSKFTEVPDRRDFVLVNTSKE